MSHEFVTKGVRRHGCSQCQQLFDCAECTEAFSLDGSLFAKGLYRGSNQNGHVINPKHYLCGDCKNEKKTDN